MAILTLEEIQEFKKITKEVRVWYKTKLELLQQPLTSSTGRKSRLDRCF